MTFPALSVPGFTRRTTLPFEYVNFVETKYPGFTAQQIASKTSRLYSQLRKRYTDGQGRVANIPFGQSPAQLTASGTAPPTVQLSGVPTLGDITLQIQITTGGASGTAVFQWSPDNVNWTAGVTTGPAVALGSTGITANFGPAGQFTYSTNNVYVAPTPVPETFLNWIVDLVSFAVLRKRKPSANDPETQLFEKAAATALEEVEKAANSQTGLYDLPVNDQGDSSAIATTGPIGYTEESPYVSADRQEREGYAEDARGSGTYIDGDGNFSGWPQ